MIRKAILKVYITVRNVTLALGLHRFSIVKKITAVTVRNLKQDFAVANGHKMLLDKNDALQLSIEEYEPMTTKIFEKYITDGNTVLDLGANIGYFALLAGKLVGGGRYLLLNQTRIISP